ncbi:PQQ-binding-like beta-propeller repeat protein [Streptomyces sp. NPDC018693]|uniref:protein kinase domain-containing protein n=1 Tax=unclassified Streptomyces TaxID=2593676 RepID=UPI0037A8114B
MPVHKDDPRSLGGYRIVDRLGAGGMGVVYRARSRSGREVAVKLVHAQYAEDPVFRARFQQEIAAVRKVSGAFTAPVVDADPEAVRPWMATQYVPAPSLAERIRTHGPLRGAELRRLALGLVEALRDIHRAGVVHRDLKPANVLMAEDGPRVIDFGISRAAENQTLTETGHMIGTPPFMSPEQFTDARSVGPASDVFSLGALLVYAVTGHGPFDADSPYLTAYRVMTEEPALDAVGEPLRGVLARCLAKTADERPSLDDLAGEFGAVLPEPAPGDMPTVTLRLPSPDAVRTPTAADHTPVPPARRGRSRLLALTGAVGVLAVALTAYLLIGLPENDDRGTATADSAGPSAASRWRDLPDGWQPWQTTVLKTARQGAEQPLGGTGAVDGQPFCHVSEGAAYCGGVGVLPVRIDARTGETVWRADIAPKGIAPDRYDSSPLGVHDGTVLVQETISNTDGDYEKVSVIGLDAGSGARLWSWQANTDFTDMVLSGGLVLTTAVDGRSVTARSARDGAERWTTALPANHYCSYYDLDGRPYMECVTMAEGSDAAQVYALDPADGTSKRLPITRDDGELVGLVEDGSLLYAQWWENQESGSGMEYTALQWIDPDSGERKTIRLTDRYVAGEVQFAGGMVYFTSTEGQVTAVSPETGEKVWQTRTTLEEPGTPKVDPEARALYLATAGGRVAALDTRTGEVLWESSPRAGALGNGGSPSVLLDEGALVVATPDGTVFSVDPSDPERTPASA